MSVPLFVAQDIGRTLLGEHVWMPTVTIDVSQSHAVAFSYDLHREFLNEVADAGAIVFATTETHNAEQERPLWLSVDIDGSALRQTLEMD